MKIALYYNLPSGGAKRVAYEHCRGLTAAGHHVTAFEPTSSVREFCDIRQVASETVEVPYRWRELNWRGWKRVIGALGDAFVMTQSYRRLAAMQQRVAQMIEGGGFDVAYVHHDAYETAPTLLRLLRTPTVYFCQEPSRGVFEAPLAAEGERRAGDGSTLRVLRRAIFSNPFGETHIRFRRMNERINTLAATIVLANSSFSCESILRAHGCVARRCRLGVDSGFFCPADVSRERFVLSVGGYYVQKGFRFLVRALGRMPAEIRPPLVLSGDRGTDAEIEVLQALARECGVDLTLHRAPSDEVLRDLYRRASAFVYAPYLEPLGLTPLEAMACATPALGVAEGGVRETIIEGCNGRLAPHDERRYAEVLGEMLADEAALRRMGEWGREYVAREWTWERSVQDLEGLLEQARPPSGAA